ncbi:MAG: hypothetical protein Q9187_001264 [Circinaria calcarea]
MSGILPETKFFRVMRESYTWRALTKFIFTLRTWSRRTIWGDRLFLQFHGPTTILLQTRASRLSDVLSTRDVNEIADSPPGAIQAAVTLAMSGPEKPATDSSSGTTPASARPTRLSMASIGPDGKVTFEEK